MSNIKISQLSSFSGNVTGSDFFPIDKSSSLTTYRASVSQLQSYLSTGSFTGSLVGTLTGTSSWASKSVSASYASSSTSASYGLSSSYASTASYIIGGTTVSGTGTTNYLPIWTSNTTIGNSSMYYAAGAYELDGANFIAYNSSQTYIIGRSAGLNSNILLDSAYTSSDAWGLSVATGNSPSDTTRGRFELVTYTGSNQLLAKQSIPNDPYNMVRVARISSNNIYFWPISDVQSVSRDGTVNIGVTNSSVENTSSRLLIDVFSGSSASNPQTYHLRKAIEVRYGSSSLNTTFCVSSSGKTYIGGELQVSGGVRLYSQAANEISSNGQNININSADAVTRFIQLTNYGTASITMSAGSQLNVIVNQHSSSAAHEANIFFTGSYMNNSGQTFTCPIVWRNGAQPSVTTGTLDRADFFTFIAVNTSNYGPKGSTATDGVVIYGSVVQNMY